MVTKLMWVFFLTSGVFFVFGTHIWKPCSNEVCFCRNFTKSRPVYLDMNCSDLAISEIPEVRSPHRINLTLNNNSLTHINSSTFRNIPVQRVVSILFFGNRIETIADDTFTNFTRLAKVAFSGNHVPSRQLSNAVKSLQFSPINDLTISSSNISSFHHDFFLPLANHTNLNLSLVHNQLTFFDGLAFQSLKGLVYLNLRTNHISHLNMSYDSSLPVRRLRLEDNLIEKVPEFCWNGSVSFFPHLTDLDLSFNHITSLDRKRYACLHKLRIFDLSGNIFRKLKNLDFAYLPSLETLQLSYMCTLRSVEKYALQSQTLKNLFFRKNYIQFNRDHQSIPLSIFGIIPSLELLNINFNVLSYLKNENFTEVFQNMTNLKTLVMGGCGLKYIPRAVSENLTKLVSLNLYHNEIKSIPYHIKNLRNLTTLNLGNNEITTVDKESLPDNLISDNDSFIELQNNPFSCGCESWWLYQLIKEQRHKFRPEMYTKGYLCQSPDEDKGRELWDALLSEQKCLMTRYALQIILVCSSVMITLLVSTSLLYYYRWNLMYMLFMLGHKAKPANTEWEYDAFVAYNVDDVVWVKDRLISVLEGKDNLNLCIHNRDFTAGKLIVDNIVDSVESSRKIIIVLSNNFAMSSWCQFELDLLLRHVIENDHNNLIIVILETIDPRYVTKSMKVLLETTTYLEWGEEETVKRAFFNRLRMMIKRSNVSSSVTRRKLSV